MADANHDPALLEALLKISARAEFQPSLRDLSQMAADGLLREALEAILSLFNHYAQSGQTEVHALPPGTAAPAMRYSARHAWAAADLAAWSGTAASATSAPAASSTSRAGG